MKIILKDEVAGLGDEGEILEVSDGYARNYLFPYKKAVMYNTQNASVLQGQKKSIEKRRLERKANYQSLKDKIEQMHLSIKMKTGESGHLFGAVTSMLIADELEKVGITVPKKQIIVPHHSIKDLGDYVVEIRLIGNIVAKLQISVEDVEGKTKKDFVTPKEESEHVETSSSAKDEVHTDDAPSEEIVDEVQTDESPREEIMNEVQTEDRPNEEIIDEVTNPE